MDHRKELISLYKEALVGNSYVQKIEQSILNNINTLSSKCFTQKGVYTVFITLAIHKIISPSQDIRNHQTKMVDGFSGRTIDTQYITPTLKELGLPSMAESGWLTRSLEQAYPFTLDYRGSIRNKEVKIAFLELIDAIESKKVHPKYILVELLKQIITIQNTNKIIIKPLKNPDKLIISKMVAVLDKQFSFKYKTSGGAKLPAMAFYAIYKILINEISRYAGCELKEMASHTSCDRTSNSAGDIEVFKNGSLFEAVEIKLDKIIDANMLRIAKEKIIKHNPKRYYILSYSGLDKDEAKEIGSIIKEVKDKHGCQIVVNGVIPTLNYYMRLISDLSQFLRFYSELIQNDSELQFIHKQKWDELLREMENEL